MNYQKQHVIQPVKTFRFRISINIYPININILVKNVYDIIPLLIQPFYNFNYFVLFHAISPLRKITTRLHYYMRCCFVFNDDNMYTTFVIILVLAYFA